MEWECKYNAKTDGHVQMVAFMTKLQSCFIRICTFSFRLLCLTLQPTCNQHGFDNFPFSRLLKQSPYH